MGRQTQYPKTLIYYFYGGCYHCFIDKNIILVCMYVTSNTLLCMLYESPCVCKVIKTQQQQQQPINGVQWCIFVLSNSPLTLFCSADLGGCSSTLLHDISVRQKRI
jgi:hypothetical protein